MHVAIRWGCVTGCDEQAVNGLLDYLEEKGRNCHINTGVTSKMVNDKVEFDWKVESGDFFRQDVENAQ